MTGRGEIRSFASLACAHLALGRDSHVPPREHSPRGLAQAVPVFALLVTYHKKNKPIGL